MSAAPGHPVHVVIPTHTTRHLAACLASMAWQCVPPASVILTTDTDSPDIARLVDDWWPRIAAAIRNRTGRACPLRHVARPHQGEARLNQVRNNGLRTLLAGLHEDWASPDDLVVILDGDTLLDPEAVAGHAALAASGRDLIIPFRVMLTEQQTSAWTAESALSGQPEPSWLPPSVRDALRQRQRRYTRQLWLKRFGLTKPHKPKVLGGHHAVRLKALLAVNGYDELYTGYGFDDDDLCRRLFASSGSPAAVTPARVAIACTSLRAYHLWHPTRAAPRIQDTSGFARFSRTDLPIRCERGIDNPLAQPGPSLRFIPG